MIHELTHKHFCNLGALRNPHCFSSYDNKRKAMRYYYNGILSEACWMGYRI